LKKNVTDIKILMQKMHSAIGKEKRKEVQLERIDVFLMHS